MTYTLAIRNHLPERYHRSPLLLLLLLLLSSPLRGDPNRSGAGICEGGVKRDLPLKMTHYRAAGDKRGGSEGSWTKVKFDRQIAAIAKVEDVTTTYSDDTELRKYAESAGMQAIETEQLPLPPAEQTTLFGRAIELEG